MLFSIKYILRFVPYMLFLPTIKVNLRYSKEKFTMNFYNGNRQMKAERLY